MEYYHRNKNCGWCSNNVTELQTLLKEIKELTCRIMERRQDINCCTCHWQHSIPIPTSQTQSQKSQVSGSDSGSSRSLGSNMNLLPTPIIQIKTQEDEEVEAEPKHEQPDQGLSRTNNNNNNNNNKNNNNYNNFMYKCMSQYNCPAEFPTLPAMLSHLATVHAWNSDGYTPFCNICGQCFLTDLARETHKKDSHGYHYELCNGNFFNEGYYLFHMKSIHKSSIGQSSCSECGQAGLKGKRALVSHIWSIHGINTGSGLEMRQLLWSCEQCFEGKKDPKPKYFISHQELMEHQVRKHRQECRICGVIFSSFKGMYQHCVGEHGVTGNPGRDGGGGQGQEQQRKRNRKSRGKLNRLKRQKRKAYKCNGKT